MKIDERIVRIIPRIDIKGPHLVKGIHLEGLRVLGFPQDFSKSYYAQGADELILMDVVASLFNRNQLHQFISETARQVFVPITVGGGLRSLEDIRKVLNAGADRVSLNTAVIKNPDFIREAALEFGSSTIVVAIEAIKQIDGKYSCFTDNGREFTGIDAFEWAKQVEELGAGEIVITSVDKEGRGEGYDIDLVKKICNLVSVPVIAHGGAGSMKHVVELIKATDVAGVAIASLFHYEFIQNYAIDFSKEKEGNFMFMSGDRKFKKIHPASITTLKHELHSQGILTR
jgi:cyclase